MSYRRYLLQCVFVLILLSCLYCLLFLLQLGAPRTAEYWIYGEKILKTHLAKKITSPKLIVISGSNALYGINSELISKKIHRPVVNMGIHAGLPLDWLFTLAETVAKPGDILILPLEWEYYMNSFVFPSSWVFRQVAAWDIDYFYSLNLIRKLIFIFSEPMPDLMTNIYKKMYKNKILKKHPEKMLASQNSILKNYYYQSRSREFALSYLNTNEYGDLLNTCQLKNKTTIDLDRAAFGLQSQPLYQNLLFLKFAINALEKRGVKVFVTFPPMVKNALTQSALAGEHIHWLLIQLNRLHIKTLGVPNDYMFNKNDFFAYYHLTCEGRDKRSLILAKSIATIL